MRRRRRLRRGWQLAVKGGAKAIVGVPAVALAS